MADTTYNQLESTDPSATKFAGFTRDVEGTEAKGVYMGIAVPEPFTEGTTFPRVANTTQYGAAPRAINTATSGATTLSFSLARVDDGLILLREIRVMINSAAATKLDLSMHLLNAAMEGTAAVQDNAAWTLNNGTISDIAKSQGTVYFGNAPTVAGTSVEYRAYVDRVVKPATGGKLLYFQLLANNTYTPPANSEQFTVTFIGWRF